MPWFYNNETIWFFELNMNRITMWVLMKFCQMFTWRIVRIREIERGEHIPEVGKRMYIQRWEFMMYTMPLENIGKGRESATQSYCGSKTYIGIRRGIKFMAFSNGETPGCAIEMQICERHLRTEPWGCLF